MGHNEVEGHGGRGALEHEPFDPPIKGGGVSSASPDRTPNRYRHDNRQARSVSERPILSHPYFLPTKLNATLETEITPVKSALREAGWWLL